MLNAVTKDNSIPPEDRLAIDLLVDGELDEEARRELLLRLDSINGGWRVCAIAFLESQCFRDCCRAQAPVVCGPAVQVSHASGRKWTREQELEGQKRLLRDLFPESGLFDSGEGGLSDLTLERGKSGRSQGQDAPVEGTAALQTQPMALATDPLVIPLKKGGYRGGGAKGLNGSTGGPTLPTILGAMAAGFLVALLLASFAFWAFLPARVPSAVPRVMEGMTPPVATVTPEIPPLAGDGIANIVAEAAPATHASAAPVHQVTLKSPSSDFNGIRVPCVEADRYDPDSLRTLRSQTSNAWAEDMRKQGHDVETVYEDLMFPLDDGRTLILPVDTYRVRSPVRYQ
ncbi:MAG: hypothetical protein Q4G68_12710 [Planctomycetia bacterium]|nr:hypothetical protein [Planctomycetia bacterium]